MRTGSGRHRGGRKTAFVGRQECPHCSVLAKRALTVAWTPCALLLALRRLGGSKGVEQGLRGKRSWVTLSEYSRRGGTPLEEGIENRAFRQASPSYLRVRTRKAPFEVWFSGDSTCKTEAPGSSPTLSRGGGARSAVGDRSNGGR